MNAFTVVINILSKKFNFFSQNNKCNPRKQSVLIFFYAHNTWFICRL